jgi:lysophospholipid acyltransferase (LPLAT)-like uncharacterized protein
MKKKLLKILMFPIIRLWAASWRFKGKPPTEKACIMLMWHEELFPVIKSGSWQDWIGITSPSRDGDFMARLVAGWGYKTIRGSASQHGSAVKVLRDTIKLARNNKLCIGVDGPRGPRRQVKIGMLLAAQKAAVPLYLIRIRARGFRFEKTWDKTLLPYPFAKVTVLTSDPIYIDKSLGRDELQTLSNEIADRLNQLGD